MIGRRVVLAAPLAACVLGGAAFWTVLRRMDRGEYDPHGIDNPLLGRKLPASTPALPPGPLLVNFFASWCEPCRAELPALLALHKQGVAIYGVAYKDSESNISALLSRSGNPYRQVMWDPQGRLAIDWGVSGVPETYLVDSSGIIRSRWTGVLPADSAGMMGG